MCVGGRPWRPPSDAGRRRPVPRARHRARRRSSPVPDYPDFAAARDPLRTTPSHSYKRSVVGVGGVGNGSGVSGEATPVAVAAPLSGSRGDARIGDARSRLDHRASTVGGVPDEEVNFADGGARLGGGAKLHEIAQIGELIGRDRHGRTRRQRDLPDAQFLP